MLVWDMAGEVGKIMGSQSAHHRINNSGNSGSDGKATGERRSQVDRRRDHLKTFFYQFVNPRRQNRARRETDPFAFHVDFHGPGLLLVVLITVSLCVVDIFATLSLLQQGGVELNPFMRELIQTDVWLFFLFKYIVTAAGLFVLLSFKKFRVYRSLSALHTLYGVLAVYVMLVVYQIGLLSTVASG